MAADDTPPLGFVAADDAVRIERTGVTWWSAINGDTVGSTAFEYGRSVVEPRRATMLTPSNQFDDTADEVAAMITAGTATVSVGGDTTTLSPYDCVFVPAGVGYAGECAGRSGKRERGGYSFRSGAAPVEFVWGVAAHDKPPLYDDDRPAVGGGTSRVVRPFVDLDPSVSFEPGNASRRWDAVCPETVGSTRLNAGLFQRPPGSSMDRRGHDPPTISEAFTVLEGRMRITGPGGEAHVLERNDFLYVPEGGEHANANAGTDTLTYTCLETPARSRAVSPAET